jgi:aquaporin Z
MRECIAEALGTLFLVLCGTLAIVVNDASGGAVTHVGISLAFGLAVIMVIQTFGDVSGAHVNPAVTLGFWAARRLPGDRVLPYVASQCAGAVAASLIVKALFPEHPHLGATVPAGHAMQALVLEIVLTFMLMLTIVSVSTGSREQGLTAGLVIGAVVALEALIGGPVSGASMNPARSLGPALVSGDLSILWLYVLAPAAGALAAIGACRIVRTSPDCCRDPGGCTPAG